MYGKGIDIVGEILDLAVEENLISKSGSWYSYKGERIGQGKQNAIDWLEENNNIANELSKEISIKKGLINGRQVQQSDTRGEPEEADDIN